jgi:hypothetical protein
MFFYLIYSLIAGILTLAFYGILQWLHLDAGSLTDWLIGIASFWWLIVIVTIPWNVYFEAREVLAETEISQEKGITFDEQKRGYLQKVSFWSLTVAIVLHILSTAGLYTLAATGISVVGYVSSGAALLLTFLRPAIRAYQYLAARLAMIRQEIKYPREDIMELRQRFQFLEENLANMERQINPQDNNSLVAKLQQDNQQARQDLAKLRAQLEKLQANNELAHQELSREASQAISQLTEDSQFLGHVREIIQFIKKA